jgi:hypothetical protein
MFSKEEPPGRLGTPGVLVVPRIEMVPREQHRDDFKPCHWATVVLVHHSRLFASRLAPYSAHTGKRSLSARFGTNSKRPDRDAVGNAEVLPVLKLNATPPLRPESQLKSPWEPGGLPGASLNPKQSWFRRGTGDKTTETRRAQSTRVESKSSLQPPAKPGFLVRRFKKHGPPFRPGGD